MIYDGASIQGSKHKGKMILVQHRYWRGWQYDIDVPVPPRWSAAVQWPRGLKAWMMNDAKV